MLLAVTIKAGLIASYGDDGCRLVLDKVNQYLAATTQTYAFAILDDITSMDQFGLTAMPVDDPGSITNALAQVAQSSRLAAPATDILIFGGDGVLPFWRLVNPVSERKADPDRQVLTDNVYAALGAPSRDAWLNPPISLGRVCAGAGATAAEFCGVIDRQIRNRQNRELRSGACAFSNRAWQSASHKAAATLVGPVRRLLSPDDQITPGNAAELSCRYIYCNLHGFDNDPAWKGYDEVSDRFVSALSPDAVSGDFVAGSLVFTEACYGLQIAGKRASESCAMKFIAEGAAAVVGATGLAFGSLPDLQVTLMNADRLAGAFFEAAARGETAGAALREARTAFLEGRVAPLNDYEIKTLLQFNLLGDPSLA